jgi:hypothetical protein
MKTIPAISITMILSLIISSCTVFSVHPLYTPETLVQDSRLAGLWREAGEGDAYVSITDAGQSYLVTYTEKEDTLLFEGNYLRLGEDFYMDLFPPNKDESRELMMNNYFPVHSFQKIILSGTKLSVLMFDGEKMIDLFKQNRIRLNHELVEDYVLITAGTEDLVKFIRKYSSNSESFTDPMIFEKIQ